MDFKSILGTKPGEFQPLARKLGFEFVSTSRSTMPGGEFDYTYQIAGNMLRITTLMDTAVSVTLVDKLTFSALETTVKENTELHESAQLSITPPPGVTCEVRKDEEFWYSTRKGDNFFAVSVTSRAMFP
jgi:hypothetical protein